MDKDKIDVRFNQYCSDPKEKPNVITQSVSFYSINNPNSQNKTYIFEKICNYGDCYRESRNSFKIINDYIKNNKQKEFGIYLFVLPSDNTVKYVGMSSTRKNVGERIKQHFVSKDTGGLRYKLKDTSTIEKCDIFLCLNFDNIREVRFIESYLIGALRPEYNFIENK